MRARRVSFLVRDTCLRPLWVGRVCGGLAPFVASSAPPSSRACVVSGLGLELESVLRFPLSALRARVGGGRSDRSLRAGVTTEEGGARDVLLQAFAPRRRWRYLARAGGGDASSFFLARLFTPLFPFPLFLYFPLLTSSILHTWHRGDSTHTHIPRPRITFLPTPPLRTMRTKRLTRGPQHQARGELRGVGQNGNARTTSYSSEESPYSSDDDRDAEMADVEADDGKGESDEGWRWGWGSTGDAWVGPQGYHPLPHHQLTAPQLAPAPQQFLLSSSSTSQLQQYGFGLRLAPPMVSVMPAQNYGAAARRGVQSPRTPHLHLPPRIRSTPTHRVGVGAERSSGRRRAWGTVQQVGGSEWTPPRVVLPRFADLIKWSSAQVVQGTPCPPMQEVPGQTQTQTRETHLHQLRRAVFVNAGPPGVSGYVYAY
ncbi:hypothetical protein B0H16DRAFT_1890359 [Mycena metata]|uniref:Uncharacterized protein n=1 Tax=Mycena metata TaxID=1033252 RepID=A0AAD7IFR6_9AGAR|nr:hypothetical protein B0H16DRAFT_1890359 [Mycena metata]